MSNLAEARVSRITSLYEYKSVKKPKGAAPNIQSSDRWMHPIRNKQDQENIMRYLHDRALYATRKDTQLSAYRDYLLFVTGITVGLRVSDLHVLKWDDLFKSDMRTFQDLHNVKEKKTKKLKRVIPTEPLQIAILEYLDRTGIEPQKGEYVFIQSRKNKDGKYDHITRGAVEKMIKDATEKCNVKGNYNTHSLRKTYAWNYYMSFVNSSDPMEQMTALVEVQHYLNHASPFYTLEYLGINRDKEVERGNIVGGEYFNMMCNFMDDDSLLNYMEKAESMV